VTLPGVSSVRVARGSGANRQVGSEVGPPIRVDREREEEGVREDEVVAAIRSRIGGEVRFRYPATEGDLVGRLVARKVIPIGVNHAGTPYWVVVDTIDFGEAGVDVRLTYYRLRPDGRLVFGGQTSMSMPREEWRKVLPALRAAVGKPPRVRVPAPPVPVEGGAR
jgi:hypothetical protein